MNTFHLFDFLPMWFAYGGRHPDKKSNKLLYGIWFWRALNWFTTSR